MTLIAETDQNRSCYSIQMWIRVAGNRKTRDNVGLLEAEGIVYDLYSGLIGIVYDLYSGLILVH